MKRIFALVLILAFVLFGCGQILPPLPAGDISIPSLGAEIENRDIFVDLQDIPQFNGDPYIVINDNDPYFSVEGIEPRSWEFYSDLDILGRCGVTFACIGRDIMPTEPRGEIGMIKPTGWQTAKYDNVDGKYLYNRCHLIGFQLTGENANEKNLVTGTRYMNVMGMLPFENMVADYIKETDNHVLYRVTPIFDGDDLLCHGVLMEAYSVEDGGEGICFNVFCYNVQPDIAIDYATGDSEYCPEIPDISGDVKYILNTSSRRFHYPYCDSVAEMNPQNRAESYETREELIRMGYTPCGNCKP